MTAVLTALALAPFGVALAMLWRPELRARARGRIAAVACLGVLSTTLLAVPMIRTAPAVVLIFDDAATACQSPRRSLPRELQGAGAVAECAGVAIRRSAGEASQGCGQNAGEHSWRSACGELGPDDLHLVDSPAEAVIAAHDLFEKRSALSRALDLVLARSRRVVLSVASPEVWKLRSGGRSQPIDVAAEVEHYLSAGLVFEVARADPGEAAKTLSLKIRPRSRFIPAAGEGDRFRFDLEVTGLQSGPVNATRRCALAAECLTANDCSGGTQCIDGSCARPCANDSECGPSHACEAGSCRLLANVAPMVLNEASFTLRESSGAQVKTVKSTEPISLAAFTGSGRQLQAGWHPLRCQVRLAQSGVTLESTEYLETREGLMYFVFGDGATFPLTGRPTGRSLEPYVSALIDDRFIGTASTATDAISYGGYFLESMIHPPVDSPQCPDETDLRCLEADLVVVHDASAKFWETHCGTLTAAVRNRGMSLVISGLPPKDACKQLPAFAETTGSGAVLFDRRPTVTFVADPGRAGRLAYKPATTAPFAFADKQRAGYALGDGYELQRELIKQLADATPGWEEENHKLVRKAPKAQTFLTLEGKELEVSTVTGEDSAAEMLAASSLDRRLGEAFPNDKAPARFGLEDIVIVPTYVLPQPAPAGKAVLGELLSRGTFVVIVPISTPFQAGFELAGAATPGVTALRDALGTQSLEPGSGPFRNDAGRRGRLLVASPGGLTSVAAWKGEALSLEADEATRAEQLKVINGELLKLLVNSRSGGRMQVAIGRLGRFVDERLVPSPSVEAPAAPVRTRHGAPLRFQRLTTRAGGVTPVELFSMSDAQQRPSSLAPQPLGYGALMGRGHVLMLGYSIAEGAFGDFGFVDIDWSQSPSSRLLVPGQPDRWAARRVLDVAQFTTNLSAPPTDEPTLTAVSESEGRSLKLEVHQRVEPGASADSLFLKPGSDSEACSFDETARRLRLVKVEPPLHSYVYELSPQDRASLTESGLGSFRVCREVCKSANAPCEARAAGARLHLAPDHRAPPNLFAGLPALRQLSMLARFTGGRDGDGAVGTGTPTYGRAATALVALLGVLWLGAAARWLTAARRRVLAVALANKSNENDPPQGLIAMAGEALGALNAISAGAFAGYRVFGPGDRLRNALREDVLRLSSVLGDVPAIPRVIQRIDERARRVLVMVNVGLPLRTPGDLSGRGPKLLAACRAVELIIEAAAVARAEVMIQAVGVHPLPEPSGPHVGQPDVASIRKYLLEPAGRIAPQDGSHSALRELEAGTSLLYVSDFLTEDLGMLASRSADLELDGGSAGFLRVVAPEELLLVGTGLAGSSLQDRSGWTEADLEVAYAALGSELERAFDDFSGGLVTISSSQSSIELLESLKESRLFTLLR